MTGVNGFDQVFNIGKPGQNDANRIREGRDGFAEKFYPFQSIAKSTQSRVEAQLEALGVRINSTLPKLIGSTPEESVETAMQALKEAQLKGEVSNSGGFLYAAISAGWKPMKTRTSKRAHHSLTSGGG